MSHTYVSVSERDSRRGDSTGRLCTGYLVWALTSIVAMLVIGLAYAGRLQTSLQKPAHVIDLNAVSSSKELEPLVERPAAQDLFDFIHDVRKAGGVLPNVGAILKARSRASQTPLFSPTDLSDIKPSIVVRTPETFGRLTLVWSALYFLSFWIVAVFWSLSSRRRGDLLLLAAAHLLTAIGFAALLSRPDPLRDTVLFVRYAQGVIAGLAVFVCVSLIDFRKAAFLRLRYLPLVASLLLSLLLIVFV